MKKHLLITVLLISFGTMFAQSNTAMIKLVEGNYNGKLVGVETNLYIIDELGHLETIDVEKYVKEGVSQNMIILKNALDKYLQNDYQIISSTSIVTNAGITQFFIERTYVLEKKE